MVQIRYIYFMNSLKTFLLIYFPISTWDNIFEVSAQDIGFTFGNGF